MTSDDQSTTNGTLSLDHWILWPSISPNGSDVYFATDAPKPAPNQSYEVDFSLWSAPLSAAFSIGITGVSAGTRWSVPDLYTGGDIAPVPLPDGERALFELREHREGDGGDRARPADEPDQRDANAHHPTAGLWRAGGRAGRRDRGDGVHPYGTECGSRDRDPRGEFALVRRACWPPTVCATRRHGPHRATTFSI